jgi:hypothetical protein
MNFVESGHYFSFLLRQFLIKILLNNINLGSIIQTIINKRFMSSIPIVQGKGKKKGKKGGKGNQEPQEQFEEEKDGISQADTNSTTITEKSSLQDTDAMEEKAPANESLAQILDPAPSTHNTKIENSVNEVKPAEEETKPEATPSPAPVETNVTETLPTETPKAEEETKPTEEVVETPKQAENVPEKQIEEPVQETPVETPAPVEKEVEQVETKQPIKEQAPVVTQVQDPVPETQPEPIVFEDKKEPEVAISHSHIVVPEDSVLSQDNTSESFIKIGQSTANVQPPTDTVISKEASPVKTSGVANAEDSSQTLTTSEVIKTEYEPKPQQTTPQGENPQKTSSSGQSNDLKPAVVKQPEEIAEKKPVETKLPEEGRKPANDQAEDGGFSTLTMIASIGVVAVAGLLVFLKFRK